MSTKFLLIAIAGWVSFGSFAQDVTATR